MSDKRVIKVNPDLFRIPDQTRKRKAPPKNKEIKIRSKTENNKTIKRKLLQYIRTKQKEMENKPKPQLTKPTLIEHDFESEFKNSLDYLQNLVDEVPSENIYHENQHNRTMKNYNNYENVNLELPKELSNHDMTSFIDSNRNNVQEKDGITLQSPQYGCMKNGSLPTYRTWKNQTQKCLPTNNVTNEMSQIANINTNIQQNNSIENVEVVVEKPRVASMNELSNMSNIPQKINTMKQTQKLLKENADEIKREYKLLKKKKRRRYTIGRSKSIPKVGVLVSNKTMRKDIDTKKTLLQQTPISEIKKYLIKGGFIRVGSIAPNNVLRKMYESVKMICGNVTNHNSKNLLYNYFNYNVES